MYLNLRFLSAWDICVVFKPFVHANLHIDEFYICIFAKELDRGVIQYIFIVMDRSMKESRQNQSVNKLPLSCV